MDTKTLEKLQRIYDQVDIFGKNLMEKAFPELKESDDERIRKAIIEFFQLQENNTTYSFIPKKDILAWLEKQGEKNNKELPKGEDYGIDSLYHAVRILEKTLGEVDGYQSDDGILEHKCAIEAVKRLYKQKPAWSKEDEEMFNETLYFINEYQKSDKCKDENGMQNSVSCEKWLHAIKNRLTYGQEE